MFLASPFVVIDAPALVMRLCSEKPRCLRLKTKNKQKQEQAQNDLLPLNCVEDTVNHARQDRTEDVEKYCRDTPSQRIDQSHFSSVSLLCVQMSIQVELS